MKALVTGAGGFCGQHLVRYLQAHGVETHTIGPRQVAGVYHYVEPLDLANLVIVVEEIKPDYVFHLAGVSMAPDFATYYSINVVYAANLLQALALTAQTECSILLVGTSAEYGAVQTHELPIAETIPARPYSHYGVSKLAQTQLGLLLARAGCRLTVVRPFNIIGPGMPEHLVLQSFARQAAEVYRGNRPPILNVGNLNSARDFIAVSDVVRIYWQLLQTPAAQGEVINVCSGRAIVIQELLTKFIAATGLTIDVRVDSERYKAIDVPVHYGDAAKLHRILGSVSYEALETTLTQIWQEAIAQP